MGPEIEGLEKGLQAHVDIVSQRSSGSGPRSATRGSLRDGFYGAARANLNSSGPFTPYRVDASSGRCFETDQQLTRASTYLTEAIDIYFPHMPYGTNIRLLQAVAARSESDWAAGPPLSKNPRAHPIQQNQTSAVLQINSADP